MQSAVAIAKDKAWRAGTTYTIAARHSTKNTTIGAPSKNFRAIWLVVAISLVSVHDIAFSILFPSYHLNNTINLYVRAPPRISFFPSLPCKGIQQHKEAFLLKTYSSLISSALHRHA
jgi:hypothetical protein